MKLTSLTIRVFVALLFVLAIANGVVYAALPSDWASKDIGAVSIAGRGTTSGDTFLVDGSGTDVWGTADEFQFTYRTLTGDGEIVAQVATLENLAAWTKGGVMMRETLTAGSKNAFMLVSPGKGSAFQRRPKTGGISQSTVVSGYAPMWVKVVRKGSVFTGYKSMDGVTWTSVGSVTMNMVATIYVGLAVGSHVDGQLATGSFDEVAVKAGATSTSTSTTTTTTTTTTTASLRVLHWNTRHGGTGTDGVYDPARLVDWMVSAKPDVVSLNEIDNLTQGTKIVTLLEAATGKNWDYHYDGRGNMVATRLGVTAKSTCTVNAAVGRKSAHLGVLINGRGVNVWSSHLTLTNSERLAEVQALQACGRQWAEGRVYAGDYNMQVGTEAYIAAATGHSDAWASAPTKLNYSGNCAGCTKNSRIDYVFTSNGATKLTLKSAEVFDTRDENGVMASDHKPLLVVYQVN